MKRLKKFLQEMDQYGVKSEVYAGCADTLDKLVSTREKLKIVSLEVDPNVLVTSGS